jgi:hypothetical protein
VTAQEKHELEEKAVQDLAVVVGKAVVWAVKAEESLAVEGLIDNIKYGI